MVFRSKIHKTYIIGSYLSLLYSYIWFYGFYEQVSEWYIDVRIALVLFYPLK